jgi:hypothetical protein
MSNVLVEFNKIVKNKDLKVISTGSRVWGVSTPKSDYDYAVTRETAEFIGRWHIDQRRMDPSIGVKIHSDFNLSWKFDIRRNPETPEPPIILHGIEVYTINIIPLHPYELEAWRIGTDILKKLTENRKEPIQEKGDRIAMFKSCVGMAYKFVDVSKFNLPES